MPGAATSRLVRWLDELGRVSDDRDGLTRTFLSPAMRRANDRVAGWMRDAGLAVREDRAGNVIGRLEASAVDDGSADPKRRAHAVAKTLLLGSHLDTVRNAGRYDGALGVLLPIVAVMEIRRLGVKLPFAVEVLGFSEEEGIRFSSAYLGSKAYTGRLTAADLKLRDAEGQTVADALTAWAGGKRPVLRGLRAPHGRTDLLGYLEVHIEQGPVLEAEGLSVGVVSAIAGQTRVRITFQGKAGHAGTTPMHLRRDALAGAADFIGMVERVATAAAPLVATVGTVRVEPGAPNVIPAEATLSLDVRHPRDASRRDALRRLKQAASRIARARGLRLAWQMTQDNGAVMCSRSLSTTLQASVRAVEERAVSLVSGAGHDAVVMSALTPMAMLFVRCRDGLSHHPAEFASPQDIEVALRVVVDFLQRMAVPATARSSVRR